MNKPIKDNNDYIRTLGDEINEKMPAHLQQNLYQIPINYRQRNSLFAERFTFAMNLILGGWFLGLLVFFKESWLPLLTESFGVFTHTGTFVSAWLEAPYAILLFLAVYGFSVWWLDLSDNPSRENRL